MSAKRTLDDIAVQRKISAALDMAKRGFSVFPLKDWDGAGPDGWKLRKTPANTGWQASATTDPVKIKQIWTDHPDSGIGASTEGFVVIDFDPKAGTLHDLHQRVREAFGALPDTLVFETGGGGEHWVFRPPANTPARSIKNAVALIAGIDVRTDGGYIVAPGSHLHPDMKPYRVMRDQPVATAPSNIIVALRRSAMRAVPGDDVEGFDDDLAVAMAEHMAAGLEECFEGKRNATLHEHAHLMRECGVSAHTALRILAGWNAEKVSPPLDDDELRKSVLSAYSKSVNNTPTGHRLDAIRATAETAQAYHNSGHGPMPDREEKLDDGLLPVRFHKELREEDMPSPEWVVEGYASAGLVTALIGPPATAKSAFLNYLSVVVAAGRADLIPAPSGTPVVQQGMVLLYNAEDTTDFIAARLLATMKANGIDQADVLPRIATLSGADDGVEDGRLILANQKGDVAEVNEKCVQRIIKTAKHYNVKLICLDPMQELHNVVENSNDTMKVVAITMRRIALATNAAVIFAVHTKKPDNARAVPADIGDMNAMRGGSAVSGVIRYAYTIGPMLATECAGFGISEQDRGDYARLRVAKNTMGRRDYEDRWMQLCGIPMGPEARRWTALGLKRATLATVVAEGEGLWMTLESIMLANPASFPVGQPHSPRQVLMSSAEHALLVNNMHRPITAWFNEGPTRHGRTHNLTLTRRPRGSRVEWTVTMTPAEEQDFDYLD